METFLKLLLMVSTRHLMAREGPDELVLIPTNLIWVSSFLQSIIKQNGIQIPIPHSGKVKLTLHWQLSYHFTLWWSLRTTRYNPVEKRSVRSNIRPGYILMQETEYLQQHYQGEPSLHSMLFKDFTGKSINELENEGTFYFGLGFSYQSADLKIYFFRV